MDPKVFRRKLVALTKASGSPKVAEELVKKVVKAVKKGVPFSDVISSLKTLLRTTSRSVGCMTRCIVYLNVISEHVATYVSERLGKKGTKADIDMLPLICAASAVLDTGLMTQAVCDAWVLASSPLPRGLVHVCRMKLLKKERLDLDSMAPTVTRALRRSPGLASAFLCELPSIPVSLLSVCTSLFGLVAACPHADVYHVCRVLEAAVAEVPSLCAPEAITALGKAREGATGYNTLVGLTLQAVRASKECGTAYPDKLKWVLLPYTDAAAGYKMGLSLVESDVVKAGWLIAESVRCGATPSPVSDLSLPGSAVGERAWLVAGTKALSLAHSGEGAALVSLLEGLTVPTSLPHPLSAMPMAEALALSQDRDIGVTPAQCARCLVPSAHLLLGAGPTLSLPTCTLLSDSLPEALVVALSYSAPTPHTAHTMCLPQQLEAMTPTLSGPIAAKALAMTHPSLSLLPLTPVSAEDAAKEGVVESLTQAVLSASSPSAAPILSFVSINPALCSQLATPVVSALSLPLSTEECDLWVQGSEAVAEAAVEPVDTSDDIAIPKLTKLRQKEVNVMAAELEVQRQGLVAKVHALTRAAGAVCQLMADTNAAAALLLTPSFLPCVLDLMTSRVSALAAAGAGVLCAALFKHLSVSLDAAKIIALSVYFTVCEAPEPIVVPSPEALLHGAKPVWERAQRDYTPMLLGESLPSIVDTHAAAAEALRRFATAANLTSTSASQCGLVYHLTYCYVACEAIPALVARKVMTSLYQTVKRAGAEEGAKLDHGGIIACASAALERDSETEDAAHLMSLTVSLLPGPLPTQILTALLSATPTSREAAVTAMRAASIPYRCPESPVPSAVSLALLTLSCDDTLDDETKHVARTLRLSCEDDGKLDASPCVKLSLDRLVSALSGEGNPWARLAITRALRICLEEAYSASGESDTERAAVNDMFANLIGTVLKCLMYTTPEPNRRRFDRYKGIRAGLYQVLSQLSSLIVAHNTVLSLPIINPPTDTVEAGFVTGLQRVGKCLAGEGYEGEVAEQSVVCAVLTGCIRLGSHDNDHGLESPSHLAAKSILTSIGGRARRRMEYLLESGRGDRQALRSFSDSTVTNTFTYLCTEVTTNFRGMLDTPIVERTHPSEPVDMRPVLTMIAASLLGHLVSFYPALAEQRQEVAGRVTPLLYFTAPELHDAAMVQDAAAAALVSTFKTDADAANRALEEFIEIINDEAADHAKHLGAARGLASVAAALGPRCLCGGVTPVLDIMIDYLSHSNGEMRLVGLVAMKQLALSMGRLFEPYLFRLMPHVLNAYADPISVIRTSAEKTMSATMSGISAHGVSYVLPPILGALKSPQWKTCLSAITVLGSLPLLSREALGIALSTVVPALKPLLHNSLKKISSAAHDTLLRVASVVRSPEIRPFTGRLIAALADPSKAGQVLTDLAQVHFRHSLTAASLSLLVPVLLSGMDCRTLSSRSNAFKLAASLPVITDAEALAPFYPALVPALLGGSADSVALVRPEAAAALSSIAALFPHAVETEEVLADLWDRVTAPRDHLIAVGGALALAAVAAKLHLTESVLDAIPCETANALSAHARLLLLLHLPQYDDSVQPKARALLPHAVEALSSPELVVRKDALAICRQTIQMAGEAIPEVARYLLAGAESESYMVRSSIADLFGDMIGLLCPDPNPDAAYKMIHETLGDALAGEILSAIFVLRCDAKDAVSTQAVHVWKSVVNHPPKAIKTLCPFLTDLMITRMASGTEHGMEAVSLTLADIGNKYPSSSKLFAPVLLKAALDEETHEGRRAAALTTLSMLLKGLSRDQTPEVEAEVLPIIPGLLLSANSAIARAAAGLFAAVRAPGAVAKEVVGSLSQMASRGHVEEAVAGLLALVEARPASFGDIFVALQEPPFSSGKADALSGLLMVHAANAGMFAQELVSLLIDNLDASEAIESLPSLQPQHTEALSELTQSILRVVQAATTGGENRQISRYMSNALTKKRDLVLATRIVYVYVAALGTPQSAQAFLPRAMSLFATEGPHIPAAAALLSVCLDNVSETGYEGALLSIQSSIENATIGTKACTMPGLANQQ
ncbi:proteasome component ECM29/Translational activator GCN1, partial [Kipferlia bialata]|eukprot:g277.t1